MAQVGTEARGEIAVLLDLAADDNDEVRTAANDVVQQLSQQQLPELTVKLSRGTSEERVKAARGIGELEAFAQSALPALVEAMTDSNSSVRNAAKEALVRIGPYALSTLREALLNDKNVEIRQAAAEVIGKMGPDAREQIPALINAAEDAALRKNAVAALGQIGEEAVPALVRSLVVAKTEAGKQAVIDALAAVGPDAFPVLNQVEQQNPTPDIKKLVDEARKHIVTVEAANDPNLTDKELLVFQDLADMFDAIDRDNNKFLDKQELAWAFRGEDASPPAVVPTGPDRENFPDVVFLSRLDRDGDGQISWPEFKRWARNYARVASKAMQAQNQVNVAYADLNQQVGQTVVVGGTSAAVMEVRTRLVDLRRTEAFWVDRWWRAGGFWIDHLEHFRHRHRHDRDEKDAHAEHKRDPHSEPGHKPEAKPSMGLNKPAHPDPGKTNSSLGSVAKAPSQAPPVKPKLHPGPAKPRDPIAKPTHPSPAPRPPLPKPSRPPQPRPAQVAQAVKPYRPPQFVVHPPPSRPAGQAGGRHR